MPRYIALVLGLLPIFLFGSIQHKFTLLLVQDMHHVLRDEKGNGGIAEMMTLMEQERARSLNCYSIACGKFISPLFFTGFDRAEHMIGLMNQLHFDAVLVGDDCFELDPTELTKRIQESKFVWLSHNLIYKGCRPFSKSIVHRAGDLKVGILALSDLNKNVLDDNHKDLIEVHSIKLIENEIDNLKNQNVDLIITLSQLPNHRNNQLIDCFSEIDVLIGCNQNKSYAYFKEETLVIQIADQSRDLLRCDFVLEMKDEPHEYQLSIFPTWRWVRNRGVKPHLKTQKILQKYQSQQRISYQNELLYYLNQFAPKIREKEFVESFEKITENRKYPGKNTHEKIKHLSTEELSRLIQELKSKVARIN